VKKPLCSPTCDIVKVIAIIYNNYFTTTESENSRDCSICLKNNINRSISSETGL